MIVESQFRDEPLLILRHFVHKNIPRLLVEVIYFALSVRCHLTLPTPTLLPS